MFKLKEKNTLFLILQIHMMGEILFDKEILEK